MADEHLHLWRLEEQGSESRACKVAVVPLDPYRGGLSSVRLAHRNWRVGAALAFLAGGIGAFWLPPASLVFAGLGVFFAWRSNQEDLEKARIFAVYRGLVEAGLCFGELKWDGEASWVDGDEDSSRRFVDSVRELYGPIQDPSHLVLETDGHVWPVPARLSEGDLPVEFAHIWARQVGPCEVLRVDEPRGQDLLEKAVEAGGGMDITVSEFDA